MICPHCGKETERKPATLRDIIGSEAMARLVAQEREWAARNAARHAELRKRRRKSGGRLA